MLSLCCVVVYSELLIHKISPYWSQILRTALHFSSHHVSLIDHVLFASSSPDGHAHRVISWPVDKIMQSRKLDIGRSLFTIRMPRFNAFKMLLGQRVLSNFNFSCCCFFREAVSALSFFETRGVMQRGWPVEFEISETLRIKVNGYTKVRARTPIWLENCPHVKILSKISACCWR